MNRHFIYIFIYCYTFTFVYYYCFFTFLSRHQTNKQQICSLLMLMQIQMQKKIEKEKEKNNNNQSKKNTQEAKEQSKLLKEFQGLSIQQKKSNEIKSIEQNNIEKEKDQKLFQQFNNLGFYHKKSNIVTFQAYKYVNYIWKKSKKDALQVLKQTKKLKSLSNLTVQTLCRLKHTKWLNDQVINAYIQLINFQIQAFNHQKTQVKQQNSKMLNIKIMNTFFAPLLSGQKQKIERIINKNHLNSNQIIILPINQDNTHWFFVIMQKGYLHIFDSLSKKRTIQKYKNNQTILNILNFMKWFYKEEKIIKLLSNFPQQNNTYDCGVMMLSGIHYFIQHSMKKFKTQIQKQAKQKKEVQSITLLTFEFQQKDSLFKRFQFAIQILNQKIESFQW